MADWDHFDTLPPRLRQALAGAVFDYDAKQFCDFLARGFSVTSLCDYIRQCDLQYALSDQVTKIGSREVRQKSTIAATGVRPLYR